MNKKEKMIWGLLIIAFVGFLTFLFWNKINLNKKYWKNYNSQKTQKPTFKKPLKQIKKHLDFSFYPLIESWVLPKYQNFWQQKKSDLKVPLEWTVGNYIDYFWPNWNKFFTIENRILQKKISKKNIVQYQPKEIIKNRQFRTQINLKKLATLKINPKQLRTTNVILTQLVNLIQDKKVSWKQIGYFIDQNFSNKVKGKLKKTLQANCWSFEWTDFYPELF